MSKKKTLWDIKRLLKKRGYDTNAPNAKMDATRYKGRYHLLHICKNGALVPLYISQRAQDVINWIKTHH